jgi:hypothetical protein
MKKTRSSVITDIGRYDGGDSMNSAAIAPSKQSKKQVNPQATTHKPTRLRIGMIGGVERSEGLFQQAAHAAGYDLEVHSGHTAGRGAQTLASLVNRVDLVVIVTDVNSHNAVVAARKAAVSRGVKHLLVRRCSPSRLIDLIHSVETDIAHAA